MKKIVIIPGGFHPFHAGHMALYQAAQEAFPSADVFVAATDDTSARPFPFKTKKFLAQQAGVPAHRFIRVKSPFGVEEIKNLYPEDQTQLIFVRSEKDRMKHPQAGGVKKDGTATYLQPYKRNGLEPMSKHGYMLYLPTVQFGPGMTSATEIRAKWPEMTAEEKIDLVKTLYPSTAGKDAAAGKIVSIFDEVMAAPVQEHIVGQAGPGVQTSLLGAPVGNGAGGLNPANVPMPNGADRPRKGTRMGVEFDEATLVNDPDAGIQIRPDGGMGTWDEHSLKSNLARKFAEMVNMVKNGNYKGLHYVLYKGGAVQRMVEALAQLEGFQEKQGRRPIARGAEIDITDYLEER
jgi:hypothetical protein